MGVLDAVVVGSGPNGLAAAIELARHGLDVRVIEGHDEIGGGTRTRELTLPGVWHDVCSAAHPLGPSSPFLARLPLEDHGLEWVTSPSVASHPLDGGTTVTLERDVDATAEGLGTDADRYRRTMAPLVAAYPRLVDDILAPLLRMPHHPFLMARFAPSALPSAQRLAGRFASDEARALLAGLCAHGSLPFHRMATAATGLVLALAGHHNGWPVVRGGSHGLTRAMASYLVSLGGEIETGRWIGHLSELPPARAVLLDVTPSQLLTLAGDALPKRRRRRYRRWQYGVGTFKLDYAVDRPVPWAAPEVTRSATVHLGGTFEEIAAAEDAVWRGSMSDQPFVLVTQPTVVDPTRAPEGLHTVWAYSHVPLGFDGDARAAVEQQIERFAPGFAGTVQACHVSTPDDFARENPNYVGGSIAGGAMTLTQMLARPRWSPWPHATPIDDVYLCSAATAPGAGTHGMSGYHAARLALGRTFGARRSLSRRSR